MFLRLDALAQFPDTTVHLLPEPASAGQPCAIETGIDRHLESRLNSEFQILKLGFA